MHALHHTHCSLLIYKGLNIRYISKRLGHSDISITYSVYDHIIDEMEDKENGKIEKNFTELMA
ncbi:tyrosine-type recombinase/integrase [Aerococcus vaginalis]